MHKLSLDFQVKGVKGNTIAGHGSVFGNVDLGGDIVLKGAFRKSLAKHAKTGSMPAMLWQHNHDQIAGVWTKAAEDDSGLYLEGEFADTQLGRESKTLAQMRAFRGLSIGFQLNEFDFDDDGNRLIKEAELWEVSLVTFPMNPAAQIEAIKSQHQDPRSLERYLREVGVSKSMAKEVVHEILGSGVRPADEDARCEADDWETELLELMGNVKNSLTASNLRTVRKRSLNHG